MTAHRHGFGPDTLLCFAAILYSSSAAAADPGLAAQLAVGAGVSGEEETGTHATFDLAWGGTIRLPSAWSVEVGYAASSHEQTYISTHLDSSGTTLDRVTVEEGVHDLRLSAGHELPLPENLHNFVDLRASAGPRWLILKNSLFPSSAMALRVGTEARVRPVEHLRLQSDIGYAPKLFGSQENLSALGRPRALWDAGVGAAIEFGDTNTWALEFAWNVDTIVFEHTVRARHAALAGLSFSR